MLSVKKDFSYNMNRTSKMWALSQEKMLLRKKVDYQEECLLGSLNYKVFFNERTSSKSSVDTHRKSLPSLRTGLFRNTK